MSNIDNMSASSRRTKKHNPRSLLCVLLCVRHYCVMSSCRNRSGKSSGCPSFTFRTDAVSKRWVPTPKHAFFRPRARHPISATRRTRYCMGGGRPAAVVCTLFSENSKRRHTRAHDVLNTVRDRPEGSESTRRKKGAGGIPATNDRHHHSSVCLPGTQPVLQRFPPVYAYTQDTHIEIYTPKRLLSFDVFLPQKGDITARYCSM